MPKSMQGTWRSLPRSVWAPETSACAPRKPHLRDTWLACSTAVQTRNEGGCSRVFTRESWQDFEAKESRHVECGRQWLLCPTLSQQNCCFGTSWHVGVNKGGRYHFRIEIAQRCRTGMNANPQSSAGGVVEARVKSVEEEEETKEVGIRRRLFIGGGGRVVGGKQGRLVQGNCT